MLKKLTVKNIAIIEDLTIDFKDKMTVLCGETGAGKSLIIDSISLLLGARADSDIVRYGEEKAYITGVFDYKNKNIDNILESLGIERKNELTIYREISLNGRNIIKVNSFNVTVQTLKNIASYLADIHVQHDTFRLINPDTYLSFIDNMDDLEFLDSYNKYKLNLMKYKNKLKEFSELKQRHEISESRLEFLEYERDEIEALDLYENKDLELEEKISKLSNYDKIYKSLNEAYQNLENEYFSLDNIYNSYKAMDTIASYDKEYNQNKDIIFDAYSNLLEAKSSIYKNIESLDFDEDELNTLEEELHKINEVKNKYTKTVSELIEELSKIKTLIMLEEDYDKVIEEKLKEIKDIYDITYDSAINLRNKRVSYSKEIEKNIENECKDLELNDCRFEITFNEVLKGDILDDKIFLDDGIDNVCFMISLNKGEPLKPLHKTASGGELSRIMLAFKSYFAKRQNLSLMVFDEIDTGVSGNAAREIARKIKNISNYSQVLCITHIPVVAALADTQLLISKNYKDGRTTTNIKELNIDERTEEIAKMMGGCALSLYLIEAARKMLEK